MDEKGNLARMLALVDSVFETKNDPNQLDVNEEVMQDLFQIHPSCLSEFDDGNGPAAWVLIFPSTSALMQQFISLEISEKELFELTKQEKSFDAIYLCSAIVLEEYRRQGIASRLCEEAINSIQALHPITSLFVWAFTPEGETASDAISKRANLPLLKRPN